MFGTIWGNFAGTIYFLYFQLAGLLLVFYLFKKENIYTRLLLGSVAGSLLIHWVPVLFSFFFDFTLLSHMLAMIPLIPVYYLGLKQIIKNRRQRLFTGVFSELLSGVRVHKYFVILLIAFMVLWVNLLSSHTIPLYENGAIYTGQCTYGDMNMHLGFITSIAVQSEFPPVYSIFPDTLLAYPFLSDSISSSVYLFGASLRYAYLLPMIFAMLQIFGSVYLFAVTLWSSLAKAVMTFLLYFLNGGLGFFYFINWAREREFAFADIFSGFYTTPTNLVEHNIRWVNVIADMFLPQRATLFGYAMAFPCIFLLYRAVFEQQKKYFLYAGILVSGLPMIHTHSFLGIGLISASWLLLYLYSEVHTEKKASWIGKNLGGIILVLFVLLMTLVQKDWVSGEISADTLMKIGIVGILILVLFGVVLLVRYLSKGKIKELLSTWGVYLLCVMLFALPQLFFWTFGQVSEGGFVRGHFNWGNQGDFYIWFYLKNIGMPLLLIFGAVFAERKKTAVLFVPAAVIWFLAEFIVFTPNTYDNNKLLYIAYFLLCCGAADYAIALYEQAKKIGGVRILAGIFMFFTLFSGVLTLQREIVSEYQLYGTSHVKLAEYINENTEKDAVFLTNNRHNNEIASLTGRNIVCGSDSYLYFHGIDTSMRKEDLQKMFEQPQSAGDLYEKYQVDYVLVSSYERTNYQVAEQYFIENAELVFSDNDVQLYQLNGD